MIDKCIFSENTVLYKIIAIIFLVILLIISIMYYIYVINNSNKNKENFVVSDPCYIEHQEPINIETRNCSVYFTDNEKDCDENEDDYKLSQLELARKIKDTTNDPQLLAKLIRIQQDKRNKSDTRHINQCKYTFNNWKEINKNNSSTTPNNIYPHKNINTLDSNPNFQLFNSCFKEYIDENTTIDIATDQTTLSSCTVPLTKVKDINNNNNNQKYLAINFNNPLNFIDIYNAACSTSQHINLNIAENQYVLFFNLKYVDNDNIYIKTFDLINYFKNTNQFNLVTDASKKSQLINNMFRLSYNATSKDIIYTPKRINTTSYMIKFNMCNKISAFTQHTFTFSFNDIAGLDDKLIKNVNVTELINTLDTDTRFNDETVDCEQYIKDDIQSVIDAANISIGNDNDPNSLLGKKKAAEGQIVTKQSTLVSSYANNSQTITKNNRDILRVLNKLKNVLSTIPSKRDIITNTNNKRLKLTYRDELLALQEEIIELINNYYEIADTNNNANYGLLQSDYLSSHKLWENQSATASTVIGSNYIVGVWQRIYPWYWEHPNQEWYQRAVDYLYAYQSPYKTETTTDINFYKWDQNVFTEFIGTLQCKVPGFYHFFINSDDAGELYIGNKGADGRPVFKLMSHYYGGHGSSDQQQTTYVSVFLSPDENGGFYGFYSRCTQRGGPTNQYLKYIFKPITENLIYYNRLDLNNNTIFLNYNYYVPKNWIYYGNWGNEYSLKDDDRLTLLANVNTPPVRSKPQNNQPDFFATATVVKARGPEPTAPTNFVRVTRNDINFGPPPTGVQFSSLDYTPSIVPYSAISSYRGQSSTPRTLSYADYVTFINTQIVQYNPSETIDNNIYNKDNQANDDIEAATELKSSLTGQINVIKGKKKDMANINTAINNFNNNIPTDTHYTYDYIKNLISNTSGGVKIPSSKLSTYQDNICSDNGSDTSDINYFIAMKINFIQ